MKSSSRLFSMTLPNGEIKFEFGRGSEIYRFNCDNCGHKFSVNGDNMPKDWKKQNIVLINCSNCKFQNKYLVAYVTALTYKNTF